MTALRIALIPLDCRPCNFEQVVDLARVVGIQVMSPPEELVRSHEERPDRFRSLESWLEKTLPQVDALAISLDQWLYGGLIQSRKLSTASTENVSERLARLWEILKRYPSVRVHGFQILLRLSVTVNAQQTEADWRNIFQYSVVAGKIESAKRIGKESPELDQELAQLKAQIPAELLSEYLKVRDRNHQASLAVAAQVGRFSTLVFGQEDCAPHGLHREEKNRLREALQAQPEEVRPACHVLTGADELGFMSLMTAWMNHQSIPAGNLPMEVRVVESEGFSPAWGEWDELHTSLQAVSAYEDIPAGNNLALHLAPSPFRAATEGESGPVIWVVPFDSEGQKDLCFAPAEAIEPGSEREKLYQSLAKQIRPGDALLDLTYGNGADPSLLSALTQGGFRLNQLSAFSAWNTSGNRMGSLIAQLAFQVLGKSGESWNEAADRAFLEAQVLDHGAYQSQIRGKLTAQAQKEGLNPWALPSEAWQRLGQEANTLVQDQAKAWGFQLQPRSSLPWPRLFEISIRS